MAKTYRVSFEDRGIRLFGILLFSILGTVFMDYGERSPALMAAEFVTMLIGTTLIWHLNRGIIFYYVASAPTVCRWVAACSIRYCSISVFPF
ncbi:MAG: hypothetical protein HC913_10690 [Microscillaceae bacterium]|nr:hypothetical protein [Microscillaceae bacterium]